MTDHAIKLVRNHLVSSINELALHLEMSSAHSSQTFFESRMGFINSQFKALLEMEEMTIEKQ